MASDMWMEIGSYGKIHVESKRQSKHRARHEDYPGVFGYGENGICAIAHLAEKAMEIVDCDCDVVVPTGLFAEVRAVVDELNTYRKEKYRVRLEVTRDCDPQWVVFCHGRCMWCERHAGPLLARLRKEIRRAKIAEEHDKRGQKAWRAYGTACWSDLPGDVRWAWCEIAERARG